MVRHGKTLMNTLDKVQGWCDSPLTPEGAEVAHYLGLGLKDVPFRSVYCSTLKRTKDTAEIILKAKEQPDALPIEIEGFKEAGFGSFESGSNSELWKTAADYLHYASTKEMSQDVLSGKLDYRTIMNTVKALDKLNLAESYEEVENRVQAALQEVACEEASKGEGNVLIVAHAMSISAMLMSMGGNRFFCGLVENASVSKVIYENGIFQVESMNDISYVQKGREANS